MNKFAKLINVLLTAIFVFSALNVSSNAVYAGTQASKSNYYLLYNSLSVTKEDVSAIYKYISKFDKSKFSVTLKDVKKMSVERIYNMLKAENKKRIVSGIQIFGINGDVPAFDIQYHLKTKAQWEDKGNNFKTDYFYSNLSNDINQIKKFTFDSYADKQVNVDITPQVSVVRLPVTKGDYTGYFNKYYAYLKAKPPVLPLTTFYKSIFSDNPESLDNINYFVRAGLDYEMKVVDDSIYNLYGYNNYKGFEMKADGAYSLTDIKSSNQKGIQNYFFNDHGNKTGFDSSLNIKNVNNILNSNYYNMDIYSCSLAQDLDNKNFIYKIMADGKAVYTTAYTSFVADGDIRFYKNIEYTRTDKSYRYFNYLYYKNLYGGSNITGSFFFARKGYCDLIRGDKDLSQCQLSDLILNNIFGLLEYTNTEKKYEFKNTIPDSEKARINGVFSKVSQEIADGTEVEIPPEELSKDIKLDINYTFKDDAVKIIDISYKKQEDYIVFNIVFDSTGSGFVKIFNNRGYMNISQKNVINTGHNDFTVSVPVKSVLQEYGININLRTSIDKKYNDHFINLSARSSSNMP